MSKKKDRAIAYGEKMRKEGIDCALFLVARQFGVESFDIRTADVSTEDKVSALVDRIWKKCFEPSQSLVHKKGSQWVINDPSSATAAPPNDPLTLEELREMDREWVWVERIGEYTKTIKKFINGYGFVLMPESFVVVIETKFKLEEYGKTWFAYRRKPEEGME